MSGEGGYIELERAVTSITVGRRHRDDLGDLEPLVASIARDGLLQPLTITPDGVLVCGARRLAAIKRLGWRTVNVWVRSGISDRLGHLLAEQDDNLLHKPLTPLEAAALYRELKALMSDDAKRRQSATQFGSDQQPGSDGGANFAPPSEPVGKAREQAAAMIPGGASHTTLEKIGYLERVAADENTPAPLQAETTSELARIENGAPVDPAYRRIREAAEAAGTEENAELDRLAREALTRARGRKRKNSTSPQPAREDEIARWSVRAFVLTWTDMTDWWLHYDVDELAAELSDEQTEDFFTAATGTTAFAEQLREAREDSTAPDDGAEAGPTRGHLRAI